MKKAMIKDFKVADIEWIKNKNLDIPYSDASDSQKLDLYFPETGEGPFPLLLHIHGGGFAMGDKRDEHLNAYLKGISHGFVVGSIEYRLSGEAIFPAAVLDSREVVRFLRKNAVKFNIDPKRIGVIGGSAGGNLCAILAMNIPNGKFCGEEGKTFDTSCEVQAAVDQFGPTDFLIMDQQALDNGISFSDHNKQTSPESAYLGGPIQELDQDWVSKSNPVNYINENMAPILVEHGLMDKLVPFAQSLELVSAIYKKLGHGYVEFVPLMTADHGDEQYSEDWNMSILWAWLKKNL